MDFSTLQIKEVLVPVDGSQAGFEALSLACLLARRNKGNVYAVHVLEVARTLPLDADMSPDAKKGEEILEQAEQIGESMDADVTGELLQARDAAHAIVDEAIEHGVDAILLGMGPSPDPEYEIGETAQYVLTHAPCQVIVRLAGGGTAG